jgi:hypothetical protein
MTRFIFFFSFLLGSRSSTDGPSGCFFLVCIAPVLSWYAIVPVEAAAKAKNEIFRFFFF